MQKWEYTIGVYEEKTLQKSKITSGSRSFESTRKMLSYLGEQGWELTSVSTFSITGTTKFEYFYFKRPKE